MSHVPVTELAARLDEIGRGRPLPETGEVSVFPGPSGTAVAAVLGFTSHHLIAADVDPGWLAPQLRAGSDTADLGRPMKPGFLSALGEHLRAQPGGQDLLLVAEAVHSSEPTRDG